MDLQALNEAQRLQLKQQLLTEQLEAVGSGVSYGQLAAADELVTDEELDSRFGSCDFCPEDFY